MTGADWRDGWVWLARISRPQGRKGEVFAEILTDFPEKFAERTRVFLLSETAAPRAADLAAFWLHKGGVVLHFAAVDSISAAQTLAGLIVAIPRADRATPKPDEVHIADLIGCAVVDLATEPPRQVGEIENVERPAGSAPILIVRGPGGEVLIPFVQAFLCKLDLDSRRVEMALPEGLLDLNP